ncbi:hypothetical protein AWW66_03295 [Micromonospora rosaria]|uniref:Uncharacterized protein n=1 Tax=Micromonospora rosaria TaxID=47874 RepID=A0A136PY36_9ACTN|nr:hypothetical protein [Micromonospora rosaria]KXK63352.1 hypothetical protein AWW66_03295 [Micromonospora rosaria]
MSDTGQRERLLGRSRPSVPYRMLVDEAGAARAQEALAVAQRHLRQVTLADRSPEEVAEAHARVDAASRELDGCYETVVLRALPLVGEVTAESLIADHPPSEEQMAAVKAKREEARRAGDELPPWPAWDDATFRPALLAASAEGAGMSAADWAEMLSTRMSAGEVRGLWAACVAINLTGRAAEPVVLPKGSTRMPS